MSIVTTKNFSKNFCLHYGKVNEYQKETAEFNRQQLDFDKFREIVRKYVGIKELTPTIVNEFIKKIIVHAPDKSSGHRVQKIQIIFNCIGEFNPDIKENGAVAKCNICPRG